MECLQLRQKDNSGVYSLGYKDQIYIGSSKNLDQRYRQHIDLLKQGKHHNYKLMKLYSKQKCLEYNILAKCPPEYRFKLEQWFVDNVPNINLAQNVELNGAGMNKKTVHQYSLKGKYIQSFESTRYAEYKLGIDHTNISSCCLNKAKSAGGYLFSYEKKDVIKSYRFRKEIKCYDLNNILLKTYSSIQEASRDTNVNSGSITNCAKGKSKRGGGYIWNY